MSISLGQWRRNAIEELKAAGNDEADFIINTLIEDVTYQPLTRILANPQRTLEEQEVEQLDLKMGQILAGEPLPHLLGYWYFYGLPFKVNNQVLIPRPETELIVEHAVQWIRGTDYPLHYVDVGTGSGCIPISILKQVDLTFSLAIDLSSQALNIAKMNAERHALTNLNFLQSDLLTSVKHRFNLITANLPYIPEKDLGELEIAKYEPRLALSGGPDGMRYIQALINQLPTHIFSPALILLEIQYDQAAPLKAAIKELIPCAKVNVVPDLAGLDRMIKVEVA